LPPELPPDWRGQGGKDRDGGRAEEQKLSKKQDWPVQPGIDWDWLLRLLQTLQRDDGDHLYAANVHEWRRLQSERVTLHGERLLPPSSDPERVPGDLIRIGHRVALYLVAPGKGVHGGEQRYLLRIGNGGSRDLAVGSCRQRAEEAVCCVDDAALRIRAEWLDNLAGRNLLLLEVLVCFQTPTTCDARSCAATCRLNANTNAVATTDETSVRFMTKFPSPKIEVD
jgi:hypothetical protein